MNAKHAPVGGPANPAGTRKKPGCRGFNGFDYFILSGAAANLAVILLMVGYWLLTR